MNIFKCYVYIINTILYIIILSYNHIVLLYYIILYMQICYIFYIYYVYLTNLQISKGQQPHLIPLYSCYMHCITI